MSRPKKDRFVDGVKLADNLYEAARPQPGKYRYRRPDGTYKTFTADTVHLANAIAEKANKERDTYVPKPKGTNRSRTMLSAYIQEYIEAREDESPELKDKRSWYDRKCYLRQFGREITLPLPRLKREHIRDWWQSQGYHQRKARRAEFRRLFNYLMDRDVVRNFDFNPFTTSDDRPRLLLGNQPRPKRLRLTMDQFWAVYDSAGKLDYEGIQIAMGLSLTTFLRESDILALRVQSDQDLLEVVVQKSESQKGRIRADRRSWDPSKHALIRGLIQRGRELSMRNARCPFLISHRPKRIYKSSYREHFCQLLKRRFCDQFAIARDATGLWAHVEKNERPTFHEVRSLADFIAKSSNYDPKEIQHAMAHENMRMTLEYQAGHDLPYEPVEIVFTPEMIGGRGF